MRPVNDRSVDFRERVPTGSARRRLLIPPVLDQKARISTAQGCQQHDQIGRNGDAKYFSCPYLSHLLLFLLCQPSSNTAGSKISNLFMISSPGNQRAGSAFLPEPD